MGKPFDKFAITFICGMIGVILAFVFYGLYVDGIIIDEYVTGSITIEEIMALTILVWTAIGVILAAFT